MTLVEVLIAMVLLGIAMVGTAGFFVHSIELIDAAKGRRIALEMVSSRMDQLLASDFDDVVDATETGVQVGQWDATMTTAVTTCTEGSAQYKEVAVTAAWTRGAQAQSVAFTSIVGKQ